MRTNFVEVVGKDSAGMPFNHGKFMVGVWQPDEWMRMSEVDHAQSLLARVGWSSRHIMVTDLQTGEGAVFMPGGYAKADLEKHAVWVCPMFEPFLNWLYEFLKDHKVDELPSLVEFDHETAPSAMYGYRREGKRDT